MPPETKNTTRMLSQPARRLPAIGARNIARLATTVLRAIKLARLSGGQTWSKVSKKERSMDPLA